MRAIEFDDLPAEPKTHGVHAFQFYGECFASMRELVAWVQAQLPDESLTVAQIQLYQWIGANFASVIDKPREGIRTWQKGGTVYASVADIRKWLQTIATATDDERTVVAFVDRQFDSMIEVVKNADNSDSMPYQMFLDFMDQGSVKICCRWGLVVQRDEAAPILLGANNSQPAMLYYIFKPSIRVAIKGRDVRSAVRAAVAQISCDPALPHYMEARIASEAALTARGGVLDEMAFDRWQPKTPGVQDRVSFVGG